MDNNSQNPPASSPPDTTPSFNNPPPTDPLSTLGAPTPSSPPTDTPSPWSAPTIAAPPTPSLAEDPANINPIADPTIAQPTPEPVLYAPAAPTPTLTQPNTPDPLPNLNPTLSPDTDLPTPVTPDLANPPDVQNTEAFNQPVPAPTSFTDTPIAPLNYATPDVSAQPPTVATEGLSTLGTPTNPSLDNAVSSWSSANPTSPAGGEPTPVTSLDATPATTPSMDWNMPTGSTQPSAMSAMPDPLLNTSPAVQAPTFTPTPTPDLSASTPSPDPLNTPTPTWPPSSNPTVVPPTDISNLTPPGTTPTPIPLASEPAPTDLSQLTGITPPPPPPQESYAAPAPETTPLPQATTEAAVEATNVQPFPVKLLIGGIITLLLVTLASVYIFFFAGKNTPPANSLPADTNQVPLTNPPIQPTPSAQQPVATTSGTTSGFGALSGTQPSASPSARPTSVLDTLRQRQAQSQQTTP